MQGRLIFIYEWGLPVSCNYFVQFRDNYCSSIFSILSHIPSLHFLWFFFPYQYTSELHNIGNIQFQKGQRQMVKVEFQPLQMRMFVHLITIIKKDTQLKIFSEN